jgi:DNA-binding NarL/FixJ family response regulator
MARVLLVDDDPGFRTALRGHLERMGMDVVGEAVDGLDAIESARAVDPDVVLMDVRMPGMNGFEAAREIKREQPFVQIVFVTVYDEPHPTRSAEETGAYAYLLKDSSPALMREVIERAAQAKLELEVRARLEA